MYYAIAYVVFMLLFLVGWKRWGDRMAAFDKATRPSEEE